MIKPDGVQRSLIGEIITRFEKKGLQLAGMKFLQATPEMAADHYREHEGKAFLPAVLAYLVSGPVVAMVWQGEQAVAVVRKLVGATNPLEADFSSIRGTYGLQISRNIIHAADSPANAQREIAIYFRPEELIPYERSLDQWALSVMQNRLRAVFFFTV